MVARKEFTWFNMEAVRAWAGVDYLEKEEVGPKIAATPGLMSSHSSLLALKLSS